MRKLSLGTAVFTAAAVLGSLTMAQPAAASSYYIANPDFKANAKGWTAGSGDKVTRIKYSNGSTAGQVKPKSAKGTKTISATSSLSTKTLGSVGSLVESTVKLQPSQKGKTVAYRLTEYSGGKAVQHKEVKFVPTSTSWKSQKVSLYSKAKDSKIRVTVKQSGVTKTNYLRFKNVTTKVSNAVVTPPASTSPTPSPTPANEEASKSSEVPANYLANPRCATNASFWTPSSNATIARASETTTPNSSCVVSPKASGTNTLIATSPLSGQKVASQNTRVHIAAQAKASNTSGTLKLTLQEVDSNGVVLQSKTGQRASATSFGWLGAEFQTIGSNSSVRVIYTGQSLTNGANFRFTNATVTVTPPVTPPAELPCDQQDYSDPAQGNITFQDDFNGNSVDSTKWRVRDGESLSFDNARIKKENVTVHDGLLDIAGKREDANGRQWTTGYIDSIGKFSQKYGRWEMRAKIPTDTTMTRGVWPAFWLRSSAPGEIDIMEAYGSPSNYDQFNPGNRYEWTVWKYSTVPAGETNEKLHGSYTPPNGRPGAGFHDYAVQWSPECMVFSYDGIVTGVVDMDEKPWLATQFNDPFHMRVNMQIGSEYWGRPNDAQTKPVFNYLIDSIKVYEAK